MELNNVMQSFGNFGRAISGEQESLFDPVPALARQSDPSTSHEAAASFDPTDLEQIVLGAVLMHPKGATQDDVLRTLPHISYASITPRFKPLLNKGLIVVTGEKRKGASGRSQRVLKAAVSLRP